MCAADERNFRSAYYEKVGCKNVEERKTLEILLKEKILDRIKLRQFCLRYSLPAAPRSFVWKICLGISKGRLYVLFIIVIMYSQAFYQ